MSDENHVEWPPEIWMAERDDYDQGVVTASTGQSEQCYHRYIDADIHESAERYYKTIIQTQRDWLSACRQWIAEEWDERGDADAEYPEGRRCSTFLGKLP